MTPGPTERLLAAFCALAGNWLAAERPAVDCEPFGGRFGANELREFRIRPPSLRATGLGIVSSSAGADGAGELDVRLAAAVICADTAGEGRDDMARRLAGRVAFEMARESAWAKQVFNPDGLAGDDPANPLSKNYPGGPRGHDVGCPAGIRAANLYGHQLEEKNYAVWAVTWTQQFRARPEDFELPLPAAGEIPGTVLKGYVPEVGRDHEADYETLVEPEARQSERGERPFFQPPAEVPPQDGEVVRMTIRAEPGVIWYSRFMRDEIGEAEGDAAINANISVERVMWLGGLFRMHGLPGYADVAQAHTYEHYFGSGGPGESKAVYLAFEGLDAPIVLPVGERTALLGGLNLALTADLAEVAVDDAWTAQLDRVSADGLDVSLVIADAPDGGAP